MNKIKHNDMARTQTQLNLLVNEKVEKYNKVQEDYATEKPRVELTAGDNVYVVLNSGEKLSGTCGEIFDKAVEVVLDSGDKKIYHRDLIFKRNAELRYTVNITENQQY